LRNGILLGGVVLSEKVVWNFELNVVKEYLSKFYSSSFACIREYVANAIAAQFKADVNDQSRLKFTRTESSSRTKVLE